MGLSERSGKLLQGLDGEALDGGMVGSIPTATRDTHYFTRAKT